MSQRNCSSGLAAREAVRVRYVLDTEHRFLSLFNPASGEYVRGDLLDQHGRDTGKEAFMASFPHLVDVGIMGSCAHGRLGLCLEAGIQCYQRGPQVSTANMSLPDFRRIAEQCRGRAFQFALGGRGDPDQHEDFEEILLACAENGIVPNFTSSGLGLTGRHARLAKEHCGAVAISWYRNPNTVRALDLLLQAGVRTNIHYVLSRATIDEAILRLTHGDFPKGVNAVIFLLHKPVGLGSASNVLQVQDPRVRRLFELVVTGGATFKIGLDSCCVPALVSPGLRVDPSIIDPCEGARFSCYISPDMKMMPCSFDQQARWAYDLSSATIEEAWQSQAFEDFRQRLRDACPACADRSLCMGGCPVVPEVVLCHFAECRSQIGGKRHAQTIRLMGRDSHAFRPWR